MLIDNKQAKPMEKIFIFFTIGILSLLSWYLMSMSNVMWPAIPGWVAICGIAISVASIQTAYLLYSQSKIENDPALSLLAIGYMAISAFSLGRTLFFPGIIFGPNSWAQSNQITSWLWFIWHVTFPFFVILYSAQRVGILTLSYSTSRWLFRLSPYLVLLTTLALVNNAHRLPPIQGNNHVYFLGFDLIAFIITLIAFLSLVSWNNKFQRRNLWLLLAVFVHGLDLLYGIMGEERYSLGWYIAMLNSVLASSTILGVFIYYLANIARETTEENYHLTNLVETDSLTGVTSRRKFDSIFKTLWTLAFQQNVPLCLLIIDIDNFKNYNDKFGHPAGDQCLQDIATTIKGAAKRDMDVVARIGGEEFAVLMYGTDEQRGHKIAEEVRKLVEDLEIPSHLDDKPVTVSVGYSSLIPGSLPSLPILMKLADTALYKAKNQGRNRVYFMKDLIKLPV